VQAAALLLVVTLLGGCQVSNNIATKATIDLENLPDTVDVKTTRALQDHPNVVLIDVREPFEYSAGYISGAKLIPLGQVPARVDEIPRDKTVIVTCRSGNRSGQAANYLRQQGFTNVHNMAGGVIAWQQAGFPLGK
jgi:rhodanese-related sulfurtransferase